MFWLGTLEEGDIESQSTEQQVPAENDERPLLSGLQHEWMSEGSSKQLQTADQAWPVIAKSKINDVKNFTIC